MTGKGLLFLKGSCPKFPVMYQVFPHKFTKEGLWIHDTFFCRSEMPASSAQFQHAELYLWIQDSKAMSLSFVTSLKACAKKKDLCQGSQLHADIRSSGLLENNTHVGNTLVSMYVKCGALAKAQQVLYELPIHDAVSWNTLIVGYVQHKQAEEALSCFHQMRSEGLSPDLITYISVLKACSILQEADTGNQIYDEIVSWGLLGKDVVLGNALVDMYAKCGVLTKAQQVFDRLPVRDVISWNTLITGYIQHGHGKEALERFQHMRSQGIIPNAITYACVLKACGITKEANLGKEIHDEIVSLELLDQDAVLAIALVDMYAKCGVLTKAKEVVDKLPVRNVVSWNALIAGYVQHGQGKEAFGCFLQMRSEGVSLDQITYACILKACAITQEIDMGKEIHHEIMRQGLLQKHVMLGNALVDMYAKCGALVKAQNVFDGLPIRNTISWNAMIAGYVQQGQGEDALGCFRRMQSQGYFADAITYSCVLKACGITQEPGMGKQIHEEIVKLKLLGKDVVLGNALIDMYAKCGILTKARKVLDELVVRDVVSWNALIAEYVQQGQGEEALACFHQMQREGLSADAITYACMLKACGITGETAMGKQFHDEIASQGLLENNVEFGSALVDMYAKCGAFAKALQVFDKLFVRNVVSWNVLIAGYVQNGQGEGALGCLQQMRTEGVFPNAFTYTCILRACGIMQKADWGKRVHDEIVNQGLLQQDIMLGNALVDMYAKCGALTKAQKAFDELCVRDVVSWNALIAGYAQHGQVKEALGCFQQMRSDGFSPNIVSWSALIGACAQQGLAAEALDCFERMLQEGTFPNAITFVSVLSACSHAGLVAEGQMYFENMIEKYHITPDKEHYACMVDLLGRAKHFDKAMRVIKRMPSSDYPPVWYSLLGACRKWGNVKLGRLAFEHAVQLDRYSAAAYVAMSNLYAAVGMQEDARNIEHMMRKNACMETAETRLLGWG